MHNKNWGNCISNRPKFRDYLRYRNAYPVEFLPRALAPPVVSPAAKLACFARSDRASGETLCSRTQKIPKGLLILYASPGTSDLITLCKTLFLIGIMRSLPSCGLPESYRCLQSLRRVQTNPLPGSGRQAVGRMERFGYWNRVGLCRMDRLLRHRS